MDLHGNACQFHGNSPPENREADKSYFDSAKYVRKGVSSGSRHPLYSSKVILPINNLKF
ncbi:hypothetical protein DL98DRAFT_210445 [Cadophora sp. DSE1049]|nr:hypothetical protein DL98DRAFT_210445 [Cadophora sp. DSE1049]